MEETSMKHRVTLASLLILLLLMAACASAALAQGGLGLSGNFYRQAFQLPPGGEISSPDIYVAVSNNGDESLTVQLVASSLPGVQVLPAAESLTLQAGEQRRVPVAVRVDAHALPGTYELTVKVEGQVQDGRGGIQVLGGMSQSATLIVVGDSAQLTVAAISPGGSQVPALIKLYRQDGAIGFEQSLSETGLLEIAVAPGTYRAVASLEGTPLAEETFAIQANEHKTISLAVNTVAIEAFALTPHYASEGGKLSLVQISGTVNNLLRSFANATLTLYVEHNGDALTEAEVASYTSLEKGGFGSSYNYLPSEGWAEGTYRFQLVLQAEGHVQAQSVVKELVVTRQAAGGVSNLLLLLGGGLVLILAIVIMIVLLSRKKRSTTA
jgi:hypothetical protein